MSMEKFNSLPSMQDARIAIQKSGRMTEGSLRWLNENTGSDFPIVGNPFEDNVRRELTDTATGITILGCSNGDNIKETALGNSDLTICGGDKFYEVYDEEFNPFGLRQIQPLGFAACRLMFARSFGLSDEPRTVATSYPKQTLQYLASKGLYVPVTYYGGGVEGRARGNGYDLIDVVDSGESLAKNGFYEVEKLRDCEAILVGAETAETRDPEIYDYLARGVSIDALMARRMRSRIDNPTGSYMSKILGDQTGNLISKKIGEESAEFVRAVALGNKSDIAAEAADGKTWAIAACAQASIPSAAVDSILALRYAAGGRS